MGICLRVLKESNKSRFDSYSRQEQCIDHIPYHLSGCRVHIFPTTFLEIATERERQLTTAREIKQLALPMAERQIGHRKSRFAVVNWRSRPVAKST